MIWLHTGYNGVAHHEVVGQGTYIWQQAQTGRTHVSVGSFRPHGRAVLSLIYIWQLKKQHAIDGMVLRKRNQLELMFCNLNSM
jgi:hypothetical protein